MKSNKESLRINVMKDLKSTQRLRSSLANLAFTTDIETSLTDVKNQLASTGEKIRIRAESDYELDRHNLRPAQKSKTKSKSKYKLTFSDKGINKQKK